MTLEKTDKSSVSPACFCFKLRQKTEKLGHDLPQRACIDVPKSSSDQANRTVVTPRINSCPCLSCFNLRLLSRCFKTVQALGVGLCSTAWLCTNMSEPFSPREVDSVRRAVRPASLTLLLREPPPSAQKPESNHLLCTATPGSRGTFTSLQPRPGQLG